MADSILNSKISGVTFPTGLSQRIGNNGKKGEFEKALNSLSESALAPQKSGLNPAGLGAGALKFSGHAIERMRARGLSFSPEQLTRIEQGVQKAAGKGAQNTLLVADGAALIVSVKNNTVVTVMDPSQMKDSVVTNIDSTVLV